MPLLRLEPVTPQSRVKDSTTEPPCSLYIQFAADFQFNKGFISVTHDFNVAVPFKAFLMHPLKTFSTLSDLVDVQAIPIQG